MGDKREAARDAHRVGNIEEEGGGGEAKENWADRDADGGWGGGGGVAGERVGTERQ